MGAFCLLGYYHVMFDISRSFAQFMLELNPGKSFISPAIICGYTSSGFEKMTHNLHHFAKDFIMRDGIRPVLYNSWEPTGFDVKCSEQIKLAIKAKELGAELFVVDDG